jgi:hypothetical protein
MKQTKFRKMTLKEAVLKSLEDINEITNYLSIFNHIVENKYYDFGEAKTPGSTISAVLGDFIRNGDSRVKRIKLNGGTYSYYLTKNEQNIDTEVLANLIETETPKKSKVEKSKSYEERDLHKLLSSYLKNTDIFSKTIFHEQSNGKDSNQIWTHPDMVGIKFLNLQNSASQNFIKTINKIDTIKLYAYELKREINNDNELKKAYFQAVSNSSWANYGYLVAFEISNSLSEEMGRLNQSFGIGIIELNANPFRSKILYPAKYKELDFKTIDKLCNMNPEFEKFIENIENLITTDKRNYELVKEALNKFCDNYLETDTQFKTYCNEKNIPIETESE